MQFEDQGIFQCFAIVSGQCWLSLSSEAEAVQLITGDFVVLPHGGAFRLASDLALPSVGIMDVVTEPLNGKILRWQGGGSCMALSALFSFSDHGASFLLSVLPSIVHIQKTADRATMRWYVERMMKVIREPQPGGLLLGEHLAQMMLIEVLGLYVAENGGSGVGWLIALADKQVGAAITAMHKDLGHRWTLHGLAGHVGMSRSAFALRFKEKVGISAMEYLTHWRMLRAGEMLMNSRDPVSTIALSLGYESESAFGFAFKREMGCSPRRFCRDRHDST